MAENGVCKPQVSFGIFEVDRVHLVRHRGGTDFAFLQFLLEEAHGDVAPNVSVEVHEDGVRAFDLVEEFGHVVVRFDLNRVGVEVKTQLVFHHMAAVAFPVVVGVGDEVRVEVADGAVHLGVELHGLDGFDHARQTDGDVCHFLTDGRGARGLTVRAGEHRNVGPLVCVPGDRRVNAFEFRNERFAAGGQHQSVARVVDVFARAGKVHEFARLGEFRIVRDFTLDPVFHGLHVVVRRGFDCLDFFAVGDREVIREPAKERAAFGADGSEFGKTGVRKRNEPFHFHAHAGVHEGGFGEDVPKFGALTCIAAVQGAQSGKGRKFLHGDFSIGKRRESRHSKSTRF